MTHAVTIKSSKKDILHNNSSAKLCIIVRALLVHTQGHSFILFPLRRVIQHAFLKICYISLLDSYHLHDKTQINCRWIES